jgi:hypothetical protein
MFTFVELHDCFLYAFSYSTAYDGGTRIPRTRDGK